MKTNPRKGNEARRQMEYEIIRRQCREHPETFIARLNGLLEWEGDHALFKGSKRSNGYGRVSFRWRVDGKPKHLCIDAHRLFLILMLRRPIRIGYDAGHMEECPYRHCVKHVFEQPFKANAKQACDKRWGM